jgi:hypothetical protein
MANAINEYLIGQQIRLSASFTTAAGAAADPSAVTLTVRPPSGAPTMPTPAKDSTGNYHADVVPSVAGAWRYRWIGAGALVAAAEGEFLVTESQVL